MAIAVKTAGPGAPDRGPCASRGQGQKRIVYNVVARRQRLAHFVFHRSGAPASHRDGAFQERDRISARTTERKNWARSDIEKFPNVCGMIAARATISSFGKFSPETREAGICGAGASFSKPLTNIGEHHDFSLSSAGGRLSW